jgi:hypothetical protein
MFYYLIFRGNKSKGYWITPKNGEHRMRDKEIAEYRELLNVLARGVESMAQKQILVTVVAGLGTDEHALTKQQHEQRAKGFWAESSSQIRRRNTDNLVMEVACWSTRLSTSIAQQLETRMLAELSEYCSPMSDLSGVCTNLGC